VGEAVHDGANDELALHVEPRVEGHGGSRYPLTPRSPTESTSTKSRVPHAGQVKRGFLLSFHVVGLPRTTFTAAAG
jgi:hypothetical protein